MLEKQAIAILTKQAMKGLIKKWAFLATGPLNWLVLRYVEKGIVYLVENTALGVHFKIIDYKVDDQSGAVTVIVKQYNGELNDEKLKELDAELAKRGTDLIKFKLQ